MDSVNRDHVLFSAEEMSVSCFVDTYVFRGLVCCCLAVLCTNNITQTELLLLQLFRVHDIQILNGNICITHFDSVILTGGTIMQHAYYLIK